MNVLYILRSLLVRRYLVLGCFAFGLALAGLYLLVVDPIYKSTASVVASVRAPETIGPQSVAEQLSSDYLLTQEDILKSERVAQQVVRSTKLAEDPAVAKGMGWTAADGPLTDFIAKRIGLGLIVEQSLTNSRVMNISYVSQDPNFSAVMANAFANAFIETNLRLQNDPARRNIASYEKQMAKIAEQMRETQAQLAVKERELGIVSSKGETDPGVVQLSALSSNLASAQAEAAYANAASRGGSLATAVANPVVQNLQMDIAAKEGQLSQLGANLGPNHPDYRQLVSQITSLKRQLGIQQGVAQAAARSRASQAAQAQGQLAGAIQSQREKVTSSRAAQNQVAVLEQDLANLRASYDQIGQRRAQLEVLDNADQTNIAVLSPAVPDQQSIAPRKKLTVALGALLGLLIGVGIALAHEFLDRRIRLSEQLEGVLGIRDLGSIRSNADERLATIRSVAALLSGPKKLLPGSSTST